MDKYGVDESDPIEIAARRLGSNVTAEMRKVACDEYEKHPPSEDKKKVAVTK